MIDEEQPHIVWWSILWIFGTVSGWLLGIVLNLFVGWLFKYGPLESSFYFLILGVSLGFLQTYVALRDKIKPFAWIFATGIAGIVFYGTAYFVTQKELIPPILEYYNPGCLSASCDSFMLTGTWLWGIIIVSLIITLCFAVPTGLVLSRYSRKIHLWILGVLVAMLVTALSFLPFGVGSGYVGTYIYAAIIGPIVFAGVSAPFLYRTLTPRFP